MINALCLMLPLCGAGDAQGAAAFPEAIRSAALASTIQVIAVDTNKGGSGVAIGMKDGYCYALTAQHVIDKSRNVEVVVNVGKEKAKFGDVEVLATLAESDLALVRFAVTNDIPCLKLAKKTPEMKQFPISMLNSGWQSKSGPTVAEDQALARKLLRHPAGGSAFFWQTGTPSEEGRSGGPLISKSGSLVGVCSGNQDGKGYFTHRDEIDYFIRKHSSCGWILER